jgi:hypothetical protein
VRQPRTVESVVDMHRIVLVVALAGCPKVSSPVADAAAVAPPRA